MDLSRWIAHRADWSPDAIAVEFEGERITYAALDARIRRAAAALEHELGIRRGDRVAYLGANHPAVLEILFACARLGAIFLPLNWRLATPEHREILLHSGARALVAEPAFRAGIDAARGSLGALRTIALGAGSDDGGWLDWDALVAAAPEDMAPRGALGDPVLLVYTSGTTGRPKGVLLTQEAIFWNAVNSTAAHDLTSADRVLTVLPTFHVGGLNIHTTPALHAGATVLLHRRFDAGEALRAIAADRPTVLLVVPPVSLALVRHRDWAATDLASLRLVAAGSSTVPEAAIRPWLARGIPVTQVYGLTESAPVAICLRAEDSTRKIGSCGKPIVHCEARIVDDEGGDIGTGVSGEIWLRGPNLFREYWNDPPATAAAFAGGWFRTGDVGHRDDEGFFWIDDRRKDLIITGGENVYPAEIERVLADCEAILEVAVVSRPDERWGEVPVAFVVLEPGSQLGEEDVMALLAGRLARFKHPREVLFVDRLPRNAMGKVLKPELRTLAAPRRPS